MTRASPEALSELAARFGERFSRQEAIRRHHATGVTFLRIGAPGLGINQPRIDWGEADAVIMGDLIVGCETCSAIRQASTCCSSAMPGNRDSYRSPKRR